MTRWAATLTAAGLVVAGAQSPLPPEVARFVSLRHVHGVPYAEARALGGAAVDPLLQALNEAGDRRRLGVIVSTLGFLGEPRAFSPLVKWLEATSGAVDVETFGALLLVPAALGDIGRESGDADRQSLRYLTDGAQPAFWQSRLAWVAPGYEGPRLWMQLAGACLHGLGRLASPAAREALDAIGRGLTDDDPRHDDLASSLDTWRRLQSEPAAQVFAANPPGLLPQPGGPAGPGAGGGAPVTHRLSIGVHRATPLTNTGVDATLADASRLLTRNAQACPDERACAVTLARDGALAPFGAAPDGADVIDNLRELLRVLSRPTDVKVVSLIQWCGERGRYLGCTLVGRRNMVVTATAPADTVAHEFGHAQGLRHNDACDRRVMHRSAADTTAVDDRECRVFQVP